MDIKEIIRKTSSIALDESGNLKSIKQQYEDYVLGYFKSHDLMILKSDKVGKCFEVYGLSSIYGKSNLNNYLLYCVENNYQIIKNARYLKFNS